MGLLNTLMSSEMNELEIYTSLTARNEELDSQKTPRALCPSRRLTKVGSSSLILPFSLPPDYTTFHNLFDRTQLGVFDEDEPTMPFCIVLRSNWWRL